MAAANPKFIAATAHVDEAAVQSLPNSRKVYAPGSRPDIQVPMREISQSDTPSSFGAEPNPPIWVYDTSGPYTDPAVNIDIRSGLKPLRAAWIEERGDTEALGGPSSAYGKDRLADAKLAFEPLTPVTFTLDRLETNPRFAAIARPANAAILVKLRIDMEDRGGRIELLLPYATLEPIRKMLLQQFMGEKFGRDNIWEGHLATELWTTQMEVRAVLDEQQISLKDVLDFKVGQTLMLNATPDSPVELRAGTIPLTVGRMGRRNHHIAVRVDRPLSPGAAKAVQRIP